MSDLRAAVWVPVTLLQLRVRDTLPGLACLASLESLPAPAEDDMLGHEALRNLPTQRGGLT